jgi:type I restriction enzyme S subunit
MKEKPKTLTPKLRFPEFKDGPGWNTCALEYIAERITTRNSDGAHSRVLTNSAERGVLDQREYFDREIVSAGSIDTYYVVERGDYVYNPRTSAIAPVGPISRNNRGTGVMSPLYMVFRFTDDHTDFYEHYFKSAAWHSYLRSVASTGARHDRMSITSSAFMQMPVPTPDPAEQRKIAACLTSLDEWIAAEGQKLKALQAHKKGLMQQLFPREGETRPRLRFPEFRDAGEWEGRRIRDLLEKVSLPIEVEEEQTYHEIGVRSHGKGIFHKDQVKGSTIGTKRVFRVAEDAFVLNIVFAWEQAVAFTTKAEAGMIASHRFPMFLPKENACDVRFIKLAFLTPAGKHLLGLASPGGAGRNRTLGQDEFDKVEIVVPEKDEQTRIADVILAAHALIAAQSRKLNGLRTHKKGLMQQLFPSPEGV